MAWNFHTRPKKDSVTLVEMNKQFPHRVYNTTTQ